MSPSPSWMQQYVLPSLFKKRLIIKAKRHTDLKVIADRRKYKEDLEPFPEGAFDRLRCDNIWEQVLGYITDPSDVTSEYFTCRTFADILEERRKLAVLPATLRILREGNELRDKSGLLSKVDLLPLRGSSKSWKKVVDEEIFEASLLGESWFNKLEVTEDWRYCDKDVCIIRDMNSVNNALNVLPEESGVDCSLVRKLYVDRRQVQVGRGQDMTMFLDKVLEFEFLEIYGESVWLLEYHGRKEMDDYDHLWRILQKTPNVRALNLMFVVKPTDECSTQDVVRIREMLERKPFPILDSLEYMHQAGSDNEHWLEHIYRRCTKLKSVTHNHLDEVISTDQNVAEALSALPLQRLGGSCAALIMWATWPLKVIELSNFFPGTILSSVLWPALKRFQRTLEEVKIDLGVKKDFPSVPLQLPRLKLLQLGYLDSDSIGFDDLIALKSLETLTLSGYDEEARTQDKDAMVKVHGIQKEMEKSNIWACLPNLVKLEFSLDGYGYIRHGMTLSQYQIIHENYEDFSDSDSDQNDDDNEGNKVELDSAVRVRQICAE